MTSGTGSDNGKFTLKGLGKALVGINSVFVYHTASLFSNGWRQLNTGWLFSQGSLASPLCEDPP